jgi:hypothetical protein
MSIGSQSLSTWQGTHTPHEVLPMLTAAHEFIP